MKLALLASTVLAVSLLPFASVDAQDRGNRGDRGRDAVVHRQHNAPQHQVERGLPSTRNEVSRVQHAPSDKRHSQTVYQQHSYRHGRTQPVYQPQNRHWQGYTQHYYSQPARHSNYYAQPIVQHHRYRAPRYARPRGYQSHQWQAGYYLPEPYRTSHYVVHYDHYRLPPPPRGYHYIRVDDHVVLAAIASGLITEVLFNLFYR